MISHNYLTIPLLRHLGFLKTTHFFFFNISDKNNLLHLHRSLEVEGMGPRPRAGSRVMATFLERRQHLSHEPAPRGCLSGHFVAAAPNPRMTLLEKGFFPPSTRRSKARESATRPESLTF